MDEQVWLNNCSFYSSQKSQWVSDLCNSFEGFSIKQTYPLPPIFFSSICKYNYQIHSLLTLSNASNTRTIKLTHTRTTLNKLLLMHHNNPAPIHQLTDVCTARPHLGSDVGRESALYRPEKEHGQLCSRTPAADGRQHNLRASVNIEN